MGIKLDKSLQKYVKKEENNKIKQLKDEDFLIDDFSGDDDEYFEDIFINQKKEVKEDKNLKREQVSVENNENIEMNNKILDKLNEIEKNQKVILENINNSNLDLSEKVELKVSQNEIEEFMMNINLFNKRFVIIENNIQTPKLKEILSCLEVISEHMFANSFYIFLEDNNSIIQKTLRLLNNLKIENYEIDYYLVETNQLLNNINNISKMDKFEKNHNYAQLLLKKGLILNSITLLNETIGIYILESIKNFSKNIQKEIALFDDDYKLLSNSKDFFIRLFTDEDNNLLTFFPNHKIPKDNDKDIIRKLLKLQTTWKNKGDDKLFDKFIYIIKSIRKIRNSLAHSDMDFSIYSIKKEIEELNQDFYYISVVKNILKK